MTCLQFVFLFVSRDQNVTNKGFRSLVCLAKASGVQNVPNKGFRSLECALQRFHELTLFCMLSKVMQIYCDKNYKKGEKYLLKLKNLKIIQHTFVWQDIYASRQFQVQKVHLHKPCHYPSRGGQEPILINYNE